MEGSVKSSKQRHESENQSKAHAELLKAITLLIV